jgi:ABC-type phosphate transport system substrate-binding protein
LVFIVNDTVTDLSGTGNNITSITADQLWGIYSGHITNWNQIIDTSVTPNVTGKDMPIVPRARVLSSGTRASWSDSIKAVEATTSNGGLPLMSTGDADPSPAITDPAAANYYTENNTIARTGLPRGNGNVDIQGYINSSTATGQCGYVGLGMDTGTHIKSLKIFNKGVTTAYSPTGLNIYTAPTGSTTPYYPFGRFIFLCLPKYNQTSFSTPFSTTGLTAFTPMSDITNFITWMQTTDGKGQDNVQGEGFLRLIADQDVTMDNNVDVSDLVAVGNKVGQSGAAVARPASRADVTRDGTVDVSDLVAVGNWVGAHIIPSN